MTGATLGLPLTQARPKTTPTLRDAAAAAVNYGSNTITVTLPPTTQVGDFAVITVLTTSDTCSTPTGWTKVDVSQGVTGLNHPYLHLYTRRIVVGDIASDIGLGVVFTCGASDGLCGGVQVYANTSGFGIRPTNEVNDQSEVVQNLDPKLASLQMGPNDLYAGCVGIRTSLSASAANATMSAPPSGSTTDYAVAAQLNGGSIYVSLGGWHGPSHAAVKEYPTITAAGYTVTWAWTLAPVGPRLVETDLGPHGQAGLPVYSYTNSSGSCVVHNSGDPTAGWKNTNRPWPERVMGAFGPVSIYNNRALGGARAADQCVFGYGQMVHTTVRIGDDDLAGGQISEAGTVTALADRLNAIYLLDEVGNDYVNSLGTTGPRHAVEALVRLIRAGEVYGTGQGGQTADGTWSGVTSDAYLAGAAIKCTTPGGVVTIPVSGRTEVDVVLIVTDSTAQSITGAPYTVNVDGSTVATGTTHNGMTSTGWYGDYKFCQATIAVTLPDTGAHTITVEHAGNSGDVLIYQGYLIPAEIPPWIVLSTP